MGDSSLSTSGPKDSCFKKATFNEIDEPVGMSKIDRPTPAHKENPGFEKFKAGMAKRHCLMCGQNFSYNLRIHYLEGY